MYVKIPKFVLGHHHSWRTLYRLKENESFCQEIVGETSHFSAWATSKKKKGKRCERKEPPIVLSDFSTESRG
jgi:hypothetical protein